MKKKTAKYYKTKAWNAFSKYIRLKDSKNGNAICYTCGSVHDWKQIQCGHGIGGRGSFVLFLEEVCRPQCRRCNIFLGGNYEVFIPKLILEHGQDMFNMWVIESRKPFKRTVSDYQDIHAYYSMRVDELVNI